MSYRGIKKKRYINIYIFILVAVISLGVGYAFISSIILSINGDGLVSTNSDNFKVRFIEKPGETPSITGTGNSVSINDDVTAQFDVSTLSAIGDTETAIITVKNESNGIAAKINLSLTSTDTEYFKITNTIENNILKSNEETTIKVIIEMIKTPVNNSVSTNIVSKLIASPIDENSAIDGKSDSIIIPTSFSKDSWSTIKSNIQSGNTNQYNIGDTKKVIINNNEYNLRIANKTTNESCNNESYSETACGFVIEFEEEVELLRMNSTDTNVGGYPETQVYDYLTNELFYQLPSDLQEVIANTRVISGHGSDDLSNYVTYDKLYLLSGTEIFEENEYDIASSTTHQLEYYQEESNSKQKKYDGSYKGWWLRTADQNTNIEFCRIGDGGHLYSYGANHNGGVSPAFRIT